MRRFSYILFLLLISFASFAQISSGGAPIFFDSGNVGNKTLLKGVRTAALGATDFYYKLDVDTVYHSADSTMKNFVVGNVCNVNITPDNSGTIFKSNGYKVWRTGIVSPDAAAISIVFTLFNIPSGAKLFLYNPSQSIVLGSFSSINNNVNGVLPIRPLASDTIIVEYQEPETLASGNSLKGELKIGYASHNFVDTNGYLKKTNPDGGISCSPQIMSVDAENPVIGAVCLIYTTTQYNAYYSSGSLINNYKNKPYVISSYHCFDEEYEKSSIFFFQNHEPKEGVWGSSELSIAGASKVAASDTLDFALVELNQMPPADYRPYFAGWDAQEESGYLNPYKCLHHPNGDFTKYSSSQNRVVQAQPDFERSLFCYKTFWKVENWNIGATQGGSSGSPLFNSDNKIIGCLTGGSSSCTYQKNDYYYMLSKAWSFYSDYSKQLKHWLVPSGSSVKSMDGADPYASTNGSCSRVSNIDEYDSVGTVTLDGGASGYQSGHNSIGCSEYAEYFLFDKPSLLYGAYIVTANGKYNASHPVTIKVYEGGATPGKVLDKVILKPIDYSYNYSGEIISSIVKKWKSRENYVRFSSPLKISDDCYIGCSIEYYQQPDTFAIFQTTNRSKGNSAFFLRNSSWNSFDNYPYNPMPSSLWIDAVVAFDSSTDVQTLYSDNGDNDGFDVVALNSKGYISIISKFDISNAQYSIVALSGESVCRGNALFVDNQSNIGFSAAPGLYIITIVTPSGAESHKFLWGF